MFLSLQAKSCRRQLFFFRRCGVKRRASRAAISIPRKVRVFVGSVGSYHSSRQVSLPKIRSLLNTLWRTKSLLCRLLVIPGCHVANARIRYYVFSQIKQCFVMLNLMERNVFHRRPINFLRRFLNRQPIRVLRGVFVDLRVVRSFGYLRRNLTFKSRTRPFFFRNTNLIR